MFSFPPSVRIVLAAGPTDLRKSFDGLAAAARLVLRDDPLSGDLFVFCNRRRNRLKILVFDGTGPWVLAKRLERGTFAWPEAAEGTQRVEIGGEDLGLILAGIDVEETARRRWYRRRKRSA